MRPRLLDMYCCSGGAARGYQRAGFHVTGWDIAPQPRYAGDEFEQRDVLDANPAEIAASFDAIHASPICQGLTRMRAPGRKQHPNLIPATVALLQATGLPWVLENVEGAEPWMPEAITLCGTMFGLGAQGAELRRHRLFETSFPVLAPKCQHGSRDTIGVYGGHIRNRRRARTIGIYGEGARDSRRKFDKGVPDFTSDQGREAMQIDWMTIAELSQAIPPAFTEFLARQWLAALSLDRAT